MGSPAFKTLPLLCLASNSALASCIISSKSFDGSGGNPSTGSLLAILSELCVLCNFGPDVPALTFNFLTKNDLAGEAKNAVESAVPITA